MPFPALVVALGPIIGGAVVATASDTLLGPVIASARDKLAQKLRLGQYEAIDNALQRAYQDVINQIDDSVQREQTGQVLKALLDGASGQPLEAFCRQVTYSYLLPSTSPPNPQSLAQLYRKFCGPRDLISGKAPSELFLTDLFEAFFLAFREQLLREPDFAHLREYSQLDEIRTQTNLQQALVKLNQALLYELRKLTEQQAISENLGFIAEQYKSYLINDLKDHTIRGFAPQVGGKVLSLPLAKVFLPLQAVEGRPVLSEFAEQDLKGQVLSEFASELDWLRQREEMEKRLTRLNAQQSAQRSLKLADFMREGRSVLLGDPGTGKSTTTRYIAYALAADDTTYIGENARDLVPVLVRIANYGRALEQDKTLHLIEYIENELFPRAEFGLYLRYAIEQGNCFIILDGLDEVAELNLRIEVTQRIQQMVASYGANRFLVSSRIIGYNQSSLTREFKHATLKELEQDDQERFIRSWYEAINTEISSNGQATGAQDLIDALREKPQIARMGANPLLLTIMVLMHWRGVKLPSRRVQVYQIATDTLIEHWTEQRGIVELDAEETKAILAPIAHYILSSGVSGVIGYHDLLPLFYKGIEVQRGCIASEARQIGRSLLQNLNEQSGIFLERGLDEANQPVYGFLHQTFGEYLAALHMAQEIFEDKFELQKYIHRGGWHEPLLLLVGHLSIVSQAHSTKLLRSILAFEAPFENILRRNLLFAIDCLVDDIQIQAQLRNEILAELAKLLEHEAPQVRSAALDRYKRLRITRHNETAVTELIRLYPCHEIDLLKAFSPETQFNIATALVYLGAVEIARSLVWYMDEPKSQIKNQATLRRLRIEGWPEEAVEYLLHLQNDKRDPFIALAGFELADCTIGPVTGELLQRILDDTKFHLLLSHLAERVTDKDEKSVFQWIATIAQPVLQDRLLPFLESDVTPYIRRLAATKLLNTKYRTTSTKVLHDLVAHEASESPAAANILLETGETDHLEWRLLIDTAFLANHRNAPASIDILLKTDHEVIGLSAALHLFAVCSPSYDRDQRLKLVMDSLVQHGYADLGFAVAQWLALRPGYRFRLHACEILLEAGRIQEVIPLLQYLAYEHHTDDSQRACQHLLKYREAQRIVPLLATLSEKAEPDTRYQACLARALAPNVTIHNLTDKTPSRTTFKLEIIQGRRHAYNTALANLVKVGNQTLSAHKMSDASCAEYLWIGQISLQWLQHLHYRDYIDQAISRQLNLLPNNASPVFHLNVALFWLRLGQVEVASHILNNLLAAHDSLLLSPPLESTIISSIGRIARFETLPLLIRALRDEESSVRSAAARALGSLADATAIPFLITALSDENSNVRWSAAGALGNFDDATAVPSLITALSDENSNVRSAAASALGTLGDMTAVPHLITALNAKDWYVRYSVAHALGSLANVTAMPPLITALSDENSNVRTAVARALGSLADARAVPPLITALSDENSNVRSTAARVLCILGGATATPHLITALSDGDSNVRTATARALGSLADTTAVPHLITALGDKESSVRSAAADALGGLADVTAMPHLITALSDKESSVRSAAADALDSLADMTAVPHLITALSDKENSVRSAAAGTLGNLGDVTAVPSLITALSDENSGVRSAAADALGNLGDVTAVPHLIIALSDEDSSVRWSTARALGNLGDVTAVPHLITALSDENSSVRSAAADALGSLADATAVPHLITALSDGENYVDSSVVTALGKLDAVEWIDVLVALSDSAYSWQARQLAVTLIHLKPDRALIFLNECTRKFRRENWFDLCGQALWQLGQKKEAEINLHEAIVKEEDSPNLLALAHYYLEYDDLLQATETIQKALVKANRFEQPTCWLSQAVVLWICGEQDKAREKLVQAKRRVPRITTVKDLKYEHFWRERALTALAEMVAE